MRIRYSRGKGEQFYSQMDHYCFESIYLYFPTVFMFIRKKFSFSLSVEITYLWKNKNLGFNWYVERKERLPLVFPPPSPPPFFLDLHPFVPRVYQATTNFCGSSFRRKRLIIITIGRTMWHDKKRSKRRRRRRKENNIEFLEGGCAVRNEL